MDFGSFDFGPLKWETHLFEIIFFMACFFGNTGSLNQNLPFSEEIEMKSVKDKQ